MGGGQDLNLYPRLETVIARLYREEYQYPTENDLLRSQELAFLRRENRNPMGGDLGNRKSGSIDPFIPYHMLWLKLCALADKVYRRLPRLWRHGGA